MRKYKAGTTILNQGDQVRQCYRCQQIFIKIISFDLEKELLRGKIYDKHAWFEALVFLHGSCYIFF